MDLRDVRLADRYDLDATPVLISGTQALVRGCLAQAARDRAAGYDTAGYVTGYRGSPLGAVDRALEAAAGALTPAQIRFHPALNEDLAATALWGTQMAGLHGEGRHDGVFGLWYGKGPGVDRTGDVFRHATLAGTAPLGGVIAALGDDHTCESSTTCHQSELAMVDAHMPVLAPAGVEELLDLMLVGWGLSRFSGLWVGIKCVKDVVEATAVVDGDPFRRRLSAPEFETPPGGLSIRLGDSAQAQETRLHRHKRDAALAYARTNRLDARGLGAAGARIGLVAAGKSWADTLHALEMLGLRAEAERLGITAYKPAMVWPLDPDPLRAWASGLDLIVVVEEKRPLIEGQLREILYPLPDRPRVIGSKDAAGAVLFPIELDLSSGQIAENLGRVLVDEGIAHPPMADALARLAQARAQTAAPPLVERKPWFCAGCPHSSSTVIPEGARAYAGIGCHYMVLWMDRGADGYTHMGGEGANWIGEAPFSKRSHIFQNMGDGTYNHSGLMAIRAAIGAGVNITYKILYNDAVAMTGGQPNDDGLDPNRIARECLAMGAARVVCVRDEAEPVALPPEVAVFERSELEAVQTELASTPGVSVLLYVQTCAAEKRRRRKRGLMADPEERVYINPEVCEGCGDCGVQSNCVAILPLETPLGRKRQIDQSACNKDFSCLKGFCPAFVTVAGAKPRAELEVLELPALPAPEIPPLDRPWGGVIAGIGGTGVVTIGAILSMAAHLEGHAAAEMQMAGLAQKGGAVTIHVRIAPQAQDITAVRVAEAQADTLIACDLSVAAAPKTLALLAPDRTGAILNAHQTPVGQFALDPDLQIPGAAMCARLSQRVARLAQFDATRAATRFLGDAIFANMMLLGAAWQAGQVPLSAEAIRKALALNGAAAEANSRAFEIGRWAAVDPESFAAGLAPAAPVVETLETKISRRADALTRFQNRQLARRYRAFVARAHAAGGPALAEAVAEGYYKLLAYKDEYEVARLHSETLWPGLQESFDTVGRVTFHLAPPLLSRPGPDGRPQKRRFGPWMSGAMRLLRHGKHLRGTPFDPFGWTEERRAERRAIRRYRRLMARLFRDHTPNRAETAVALARLPLTIRGFGPVKADAMARAAAEEAKLLAAWDAPASDPELSQAAE
ncbi:MAG: indolepyruvate ferredoxin oxidoreductase family protein [Pikeienuella sp.]